MNFRSLDLNLLVVFDAVAAERSATKAALRLNLTQSSISHALGRLRASLGDDLFVRTPDGMEPTPYAERLTLPVREALQALGGAIESLADFNPSTSAMRFVIAVDNRCALLLSAPLTALVAREAPNVTLDLRPSGTMDVATLLDEGAITLALGQTASPGDRFRDLLLFEDGYTALVRHGHPACGGATISIDALASHPHLALSSTGDDVDFVDEALAQHGHSRRISVRAPLLASPALLAETDLIAVIGERLASAFAHQASLTLLALPFPGPTTAAAMLWHRRSNDVPSHKWLRGLVLRASKGIKARAPSS